VLWQEEVYQEVSPAETPNLQMPWSWTMQPKELYEELGTCGSHVVKWEADKERIKMQGQPGQIVHKIPSLK
jgi:hypothetical protein